MLRCQNSSEMDTNSTERPRATAPSNAHWEIWRGCPETEHLVCSGTHNHGGDPINNVPEALSAPTTALLFLIKRKFSFLIFSAIEASFCAAEVYKSEVWDQSLPIRPTSHSFTSLSGFSLPLSLSRQKGNRCRKVAFNTHGEQSGRGEQGNLGSRLFHTLLSPTNTLALMHFHHHVHTSRHCLSQ